MNLEKVRKKPAKFIFIHAQSYLLSAKLPLDKNKELKAEL
jgi:hypothetical protein